MRPPRSNTLHDPLDLVLGSPALVRVLRVLVHDTGSVEVSDIARRARLSLPSVRAAVRQLHDSGLVSATSVGRSWAYVLRTDGGMVQALIALYDAEREQARRVESAIKHWASDLTPVPHAIWLIGPSARGERTGHLRIALLTEAAKPAEQARNLLHSVGATLPSWLPRVSVLALTVSHIRRLIAAESRMWREVERDAVVLRGFAPAVIRARLERQQARPVPGDVSAGAGRAPAPSAVPGAPPSCE
jgi:predicted DNA-binding transcriptional regulator